MMNHAKLIYVINNRGQAYLSQIISNINYRIACSIVIYCIINTHFFEKWRIGREVFINILKYLSYSRTHLSDKIGILLHYSIRRIIDSIKKFQYFSWTFLLPNL